MAFKDTYRLEKVYYENMWTLLKSLKALKENPSADTLATVNELLDNAIADNESIILIYKNLGELYAEIAQKFADLQKDLLDLANNLEDWKDEINQKIDDNHNYLMGLIRDLEDRVTSLEGRMDRAEDNIEDLQGRMTTAEGDIDALEGRMDTAEDDIDGLQDDVSDLEQNKQDKLTAGFGIEIDANNEISVDTNDVQEKLIAGQNITLTPDATDPTKTVIDTSGGGGGNYPNVETLTQSYSLRASLMPALASGDFPCTGFRLELNQDNNPSMKDGVKNGVYFEGYYGHNSTKVTATDLPNIHNDAFVNIEVIDKLTFDFVNDSGHKYMYDSITGNLIGYYHNTSDGIYREKQATFPDKCIDFSGMINAGWLLSKITLNRYVCCTMNSVEYGSGITTLIDSTFVKELVDMNRYVTAKFMLNP